MHHFAGINLGQEPVQDETTMCKFRHRLERHRLGAKIFHRVNGHLESRGVKIGTGIIVDATLTKAPSSTKNKQKQRDPEMHQTRKGSGSASAGGARGQPHQKQNTLPRVEHVFAPLGQRFDFVKVRYRGLAKNLHRLSTSFALIHLITAP